MLDFTTVHDHCIVWSLGSEHNVLGIELVLYEINIQIMLCKPINIEIYFLKIDTRCSLTAIVAG